MAIEIEYVEIAFHHVRQDRTRHHAPGKTSIRMRFPWKSGKAEITTYFPNGQVESSHTTTVEAVHEHLTGMRDALALARGESK